MEEMVTDDVALLNQYGGFTDDDAADEEPRFICGIAL
jgi:hypothetical protein